MKVYLQWKDPDYVDAKTGLYPSDEMPDEVYQKLRELGAREYLVVEFDLEAMTTRVVRRGEKI
jgi:hypothetical protein